MSDMSAGPGWWVASDGRWYPPDQHPDQAYRDRYSPAEISSSTATLPTSPPPAGPGEYPSPGDAQGRIDTEFETPPVTDVIEIADRAPPDNYPPAPPIVPTAVPPTTWGAPMSAPVHTRADGSNTVVSVVAFLAGIALIVGSFAPWVSFGGSFDGSQSGWNRSDGIVTIICGIVACGIAGILFTGLRNLFCKLALLLSGLAAFGVFVIDSIDIAGESDRAEDAFAGLEVSVGWGFWLVGVAALVLVVAALLERSRWSLEQ